MIIRARAPLRIGLAGGGTDVSPYADIYGGAILNATIGIYAHATITPNTSEKIKFESLDLDESMTHRKTKYIKIDGTLDLIKDATIESLQIIRESCRLIV